MIFVFGGAYQGKLDFALKKYSIKEKDVYHCSMDSMVINFDKKVIANLENFVFACVKNDINALECLQDNIDKLQDNVVISQDLSQGVVPMGAEERAWREMTSRCMTYLGQQAKEVYRVFCGIETKIK